MTNSWLTEAQPIWGNVADVIGSRKDLKVEEPALSWQRQWPRWQLIEALLQGTYGMQQAGRSWLPQEPLEENESYAIRLSNSTLTPYYINMEAMLAGMLTRKPIRLENVSDTITEHLYDADLQGNNLDRLIHDFARTKLLRYGLAGILVDYPVADDGSQDLNRPYWIAYGAPDIIGGRFDVVGGSMQLTQLRLHERITIPYGDFGEEVASQIRVLEPGRWRIYRRTHETGGDFKLLPDGKGEGTTTLDRIPFSPCYTQKLGELEARPPLEEIAWLNLKDYRRESDFANQLHVAALPLKFGFGFPSDMSEVAGGPDTLIGAPADARVQMLESSGSSYQWQMQHLERIEKQINHLGVATILGQKMVAETEASKAIDRSQGDASLQQIAQAMQDCIDNCLRFHAAYLSETQPGNCLISRNFVSAKLDSQQVSTILSGYNSAKPLYTQETALRMLNDGEWLPADFDVEEEILATEALAEQRIQEAQDAMNGAARALPGVTATDQQRPDSEAS